MKYIERQLLKVVSNVKAKRTKNMQKDVKLEKNNDDVDYNS